MTEKRFLLQILRMAFQTITPWKKNVLEDKNPDWANGWNDCLTEVKKNRKQYLEKLETLGEEIK